MIFKCNKHNEVKSVIMIYGWKEEKFHYDMCMTLIKRNSHATVHGFVSKVSLIEEFVDLWKYLKDEIRKEVRYLIMEVAPEHSFIYKKHLPVIKVEKSKTFNNYDCEILTVDLEKDMKI